MSVTLFFNIILIYLNDGEGTVAERKVRDPIYTLHFSYVKGAIRILALTSCLLLPDKRHLHLIVLADPCCSRSKQLLFSQLEGISTPWIVFTCWLQAKLRIPGFLPLVVPTVSDSTLANSPR